MNDFFLSIKRKLGLTPKYPSDFIKTFMSKCKNKRVQLQLIHRNRNLLYVDSLKFVPSWYKFLGESAKNKYFQGYVVFLIFDKIGIENNKEYKNYKKIKDLNIIEIDEKLGKTEVITIAHFFESKIGHIRLTHKIKEIIDNIYMPKDQNLDILFQIENLENIPG
jgi:phosphatidylglycerophosphatase A